MRLGVVVTSCHECGTVHEITEQPHICDLVPEQALPKETRDET